jgi:hypothetical protein
MVVRRDLQTPTVKEKIHRYSSQYSARLRVQQNDLAVSLIAQHKETGDCQKHEKLSAYYILSQIFLFAVISLKV